MLEQTRSKSAIVVPQILENYLRDLSHFLPEHIKVSSLSCLVLDEADTLMDDSFRGLIKSILSFMQVTLCNTRGKQKVRGLS